MLTMAIFMALADIEKLLVDTAMEALMMVIQLAAQKARKPA